jgi:hypothetical protein
MSGPRPFDGFMDGFYSDFGTMARSQIAKTRRLGRARPKCLIACCWRWRTRSWPSCSRKPGRGVVHEPLSYPPITRESGENVVDQLVSYRRLRKMRKRWLRCQPLY